MNIDIVEIIFHVKIKENKNNNETFKNVELFGAVGEFSSFLGAKMLFLRSCSEIPLKVHIID